LQVTEIENGWAKKDHPQEFYSDVFTWTVRISVARNPLWLGFGIALFTATLIMWFVQSMPMGIELSCIQAIVGKMDCSFGKCGITWHVLLNPHCEHTDIEWFKGPHCSLGSALCNLVVLCAQLYVPEQSRWLWCKSFGKVGLRCGALSAFFNVIFASFSSIFESCDFSLVFFCNGPRELLNIYIGYSLTLKPTYYWESWRKIGGTYPLEKKWTWPSMVRVSVHFTIHHSRREDWSS